ncbi:MAG: imidazolonepropionase-like amidohydrolase [Planctomycetota bacterium]|jgi:imidazolonepropionase-like amidohydrolase
MRSSMTCLLAAFASALPCQQIDASTDQAPVLVVAETLHTMVGPPLKNAFVLIENGKITKIGDAAKLPAGFEVTRVKVATPGFIDAHSTVGLTGVLNVPTDQDHLDKSSPMQPELRALDAFHPRDPLVEWVRGLGVTTLHTGHGPGALVSGQTMVIKTHGRSVDQDVVRPLAMVAVTLADSGRPRDGKGPGTRAKSVAMLREKLLAAQAYAAKRKRSEDTAINLGLETMAQVLAGDVPLLITAHRAHDLASALRVAREFDIKVVLDGAAEAYLMLPQIKKASVWVLPHPAMSRTRGDLENGTMELAKLLFDAKVPFAMQSGYESYVPKTRVVLWEAGISVMHGLSTQDALHAMTTSPAEMLGISDRVGRLRVGMDGDVALFDGDPFEYTTHCLGSVIDGVKYMGKGDGR